jgi:hypothetical protein
MWQWLHDLSQGQATFLGWLVGILTLVGGALFNARLNRNRDDRLRREDQRSIAAAMRAELSGIDRRLSANSDRLRSTVLKQEGNGLESIFVPDISHSVRVLPEMTSKIGLLDPETIRDVIDAYIVVEQYGEQLLRAVGGSLIEQVGEYRRGIVLANGVGEVNILIAVNEGTSDAIQTALKKLDAYL